MILQEASQKNCVFKLNTLRKNDGSKQVQWTPAFLFQAEFGSKQQPCPAFFCIFRTLKAQKK